MTLVPVPVVPGTIVHRAVNRVMFGPVWYWSTFVPGTVVFISQFFVLKLMYGTVPILAHLVLR